MKFDLVANKKSVAVILAAAVFIYIDLAYVLKAQVAAHGRIRPQIVKIKSDLNDLAAGLLKMRSLENNPAALKQGAASSAKKLIQESEIDSLLQDISKVAAGYNVSILSMQKRPYKEDTAAVKAKSAGAMKFTPYLINMSLSCGYNDFGKFINDLENSRDFIAVTNITVTSGKKDFYTQDVSLALKTYVVR